MNGCETRSDTGLGSSSHVGSGKMTGVTNLVELCFLPIAMSSLLALPNEILEQIVVQCAYERSLVSISFLSQTCAVLRNLIYYSSDTMLWKEVYLSMLDYPWSTRNIISKFLETPTRNDFDWKGKFIAAMLLQKELKGSNLQLLEARRLFY